MKRLAQLATAASLAACAHAPVVASQPPSVMPVDRVVIQTEKPLVSFRIFFLAGSVSDPVGKEGLTALTAQLMLQGGTQALSAAEFQSALFPLAAELSVESDAESTVFVARVHQDLLEKFVPLLTDVVAHPRFDPKELERVRSDALNDLTIRLRHNDDENLGKEALQALLYDGHPYGFPVTGTVQGLKAITLDDVKAQWQNVFTRDRMVVGLIGHTASNALADRVEQALSTLPWRGAPLSSLNEPRDDGVKALFVDKPGDSTALSLGYTWNVKRSDDDFDALWVGNSALGEHRELGGVLFDRLREKRGLNYGDYSYLEHFVESDGTTYPAPNHGRHQQYFSVWLRPVQNDNRGFALRGAIFEIGRVLKEGFTAEQVERTKAFLRTYTLQWEAADGRRLGYALDDVFYGTPSFLDSFRAKLPSITDAQVNAALRAHLDPQQLRFAIVTKGAAGFQRELILGNPTPIKYDSPKPELVAEDKQIETAPLALDEPQTRMLSTDQLFETRGLGFGTVPTDAGKAK